MSKSTTIPKIVDFQQVQSLNDDILLIDVREPSELQQFGVLPKSINIPLGNVEKAFKELSSEDFKKEYGCKKPESNNSLVFSCKAGIRSAKAMKIVEQLGYKNTSNYQGGFDDWLQQTTKG